MSYANFVRALQNIAYSEGEREFVFTIHREFVTSLKKFANF